MKLKHIHIDSYKVFENFDIDFCHAGKVQSLVVITGVNGSGKTILLRDVIFGNDSTKKPGGCVTIEDNAKTKTFTLPVSPGDELYMNAFSKVIFYGVDNKCSITDLEKKIISYIDKLVYVQGKTYTEAYHEIQTLIDDIFFDFNLKVRFKGISEEKKLIFTNLSSEEFYIEDLSGGEKQILTKIFPLFMDDMKGHVILIDEPEDSLHPIWQIKYIPILRRCAQSNDCQFILATHSPQIISSMHKEEICILVLDDKGNVRVKNNLCFDGPYGWSVEQVLSQVQGMKTMRVPEVESRLAGLRDMVQNSLYDTEGFKTELSELEALLGYSDRDLVLIRLDIIRKKKKN